MRTSLRLFWTGWLFNMKNLTMSGFFILNAAIPPIFFATIAYYMFAGGTRPGSALLYASLGAGMMGIWSSMLFGSGGADPVAALAGDARVRDRRAAAAHPRRPAA